MVRQQKHASIPPSLPMPANKGTVPKFGSWDEDEGYSVCFEKLHKQKTASCLSAAGTAAGGAASTKVVPSPKPEGAEGGLKGEAPSHAQAASTDVPQSSSATCHKGSAPWTWDAAYPGGKVEDPPARTESDTVAEKLGEMGAKGAKAYHVPQMGWWEGMETGRGAPYLGSSIIFAAARNDRDSKELAIPGENVPLTKDKEKGGRKHSRRAAREVVRELGPFAEWSAENVEERSGRLLPIPEKAKEGGKRRVVILSGRIMGTKIVIRVKFGFSLRWRKPGGQGQGQGQLNANFLGQGQGSLVKDELCARPIPRAATPTVSVANSHNPVLFEAGSKGMGDDGSSGVSTPNGTDASTFGSGTASPNSTFRPCDEELCIPEVASERVGLQCASEFIPPRKTRSEHGKYIR